MYANTKFIVYNRLFSSILSPSCSRKITQSSLPLPFDPSVSLGGYKHNTYSSSELSDVENFDADNDDVEMMDATVQKHKKVHFPPFLSFIGAFLQLLIYN